MKTITNAGKLIIFFSLLTGVFYPALVTYIGQVFFHEQANGSMIVKNGIKIGSKLIAQKFEDPKYFVARPSASNFETIPSGASNLGPTSVTIINRIKESRNKGIQFDNLFTSASGLDPHISLTSAFHQAKNIASIRNIEIQKLNQIIDSSKEERQFGVLGEPRINVLLLNLKTDEITLK